jgi:hypothetical protein
MNREEAINYMKSSGMSDEQVKAVIDGIQQDTKQRLQKLIKLLDMSDKDFVDDYNKQHPDRHLNYGDSYAHLCGWVQGELEWILVEVMK